MAKYAENQSGLAAAIGCSRPVIVELARLPDAPSKTKRGYNIEQWRKHAEKHGRGPYRKGSGGEATSVDGITLTEAKIRDTLEHAENERIKKERQLVEQAKELGQIVLVDDVKQVISRMGAVLIALLDSLPDALDRAMPDSIPQEVRDRVIDIGRKARINASSAMKEEFA